MEVLPLVGPRSLTALNAFGALILGMMMLPVYRMKSFEEMASMFEEKTEEEREAMLRVAVVFVQLAAPELEAIVSFVADKNGIPYRSENVKNLKVDELHEIVVAVMMQIGRIKIHLVSPEEKKNSNDSPST